MERGDPAAGGVGEDASSSFLKPIVYMKVIPTKGREVSK